MRSILDYYKAKGLIRSFVAVVCLLSNASDCAMAQNVDARVHGLCKEAVDYAGCVRSMSTSVTTVDQTTRPGLLNEMGNSCPFGYGYIGAGMCRNVVCIYQGVFGKNDSQLQGKAYSCDGKRPGIVGRSSLQWGNHILPASNDSRCPAYPPDLGDMNSCQKGMKSGG